MRIAINTYKNDRVDNDSELIIEPIYGLDNSLIQFRLEDKTFMLNKKELLTIMKLLNNDDRRL